MNTIYTPIILFVLLAANIAVSFFAIKQGFKNAGSSEATENNLLVKKVEDLTYLIDNKEFNINIDVGKVKGKNNTIIVKGVQVFPALEESEELENSEESFILQDGTEVFSVEINLDSLQVLD